MEGVAGKRENLNLSLRVNGPDLLHRSPTQARYERQKGGGRGNGEDLQLSLGLSMNGRFGVDPASKKLKRSSTISDFVFTVDNNGGSNSGKQARGVACESHAPLVRTASLPIDGEEWSQRKELESVKQMEARKKRMEKLKNVRVVKCNENSCEDFSNGNRLHDVSLRGGELGKPQLSSGWLSEKNPIVNVQNGLENGNGSVLPSSQESIGSQRSGSSGFSDLQSQRIEGPRQNADWKSPSSFRSVQPQVKQEPVVRADDRNAKLDSNQALKCALLDMPYVCTKGDGMNRIEGFLYRYKNGEEVKIVCVCHGMFLSPAEFIKHAGGSDVEHPLKHIVVNTTPLF